MNEKTKKAIDETHEKAELAKPVAAHERIDCPPADSMRNAAKHNRTKANEDRLRNSVTAINQRIQQATQEGKLTLHAGIVTADHDDLRKYYEARGYRVRLGPFNPSYGTVVNIPGVQVGNASTLIIDWGDEDVKNESQAPAQPAPGGKAPVRKDVTEGEGDPLPRSKKS